MTFKEIVASFNQQGTSWEELCLEIRCESCFASVFDEVNEQMGSSSDVLARLADEFPNHYKSCLLYTSPSPRDVEESRMPSSA